MISTQILREATAKNRPAMLIREMRDATKQNPHGTDLIQRMYHDAMSEFHGTKYADEIDAEYRKNIRGICED